MVRRSIGTVAFLACGAVAPAQLNIYRGVSKAVRGLQEQRLLPQYQPRPLEPTGHPGLPPKTPADPTDGGRLPASSDPRQPFEIIKGQVGETEGDNFSLVGGTEFRFRGYHVIAETAEGNRRTHVFRLKGNVQVISQDSVIKGDRIIVDFDQQTYHAFDAESQVKPNVIGGGLKGDLYVKGQESFGSKRETRSLFADLTTCNYEHPHYEIVGEDVVVRPGRRAIFRRAKIKLFGRTILKIPFLSIPLDDRTYDNLPTVGQSPDEGYYIKTHYAIPLKGENELQTRLDYMSKLGLGYGANYLYRNPSVGGYFRFYAITGMSNSLTVSNEHRQHFKWGDLTLNTDIQKNNYLSAPESTIIQNRATLTLPSKDGSTRLGYNRTGNQTLSNSTSTQTISASDERSISKSVRTSVDLNYTTSNQNYQGQAPQNRQQLDVTFRAQDDLPKGQATLQYQRSIPIGDNTSFFSGADQTPVISFATDSRRLIGEKFDKKFPFKTDVSIGEYQDFTGDGHISRGSYNFSFGKYGNTKDRLKVDYNGQFKQGIYSDDTAQYVLNGGTTVSYRLGRDTSANLRYNYLRPYGYSPLQLDRTGKTNLASLDLSYRPVQTLLMGVQTGYDITRLDTKDVPWQQVGLRTEWHPAKAFQVRSLATYDTFEQLWSSIRVDTGYQPGATLITLGVRYDGVRNTWSNANLFINDLTIGKCKIGAILTYNGYTKQFDSQQYSLIYDLHCAEAVFTMQENNTGFRAGRQIQFLVRLKAFPFDSLFGIGPRGEPIGSGTGRDF